MATSERQRLGRPARTALEISAGRDGSELLLRLSGELDLRSAAALQETIRGAEESTADQIVIDLTHLEFMDLTGLSVLLAAYHRRRQDGQHLDFLPSRHDAVKQLVAVTGVSEIFD
jgi:anti-anti-sigma factor